MGDDQVVARELEQAEARLAEAREGVDHAVAVLSGYEFHGMNFNDRVGARKQYYDAFVECQSAALEVGRLRALAEVRTKVERARDSLGMAIAIYGEVATDPLAWMDDAMYQLFSILAALAAREEVQG